MNIRLCILRYRSKKSFLLNPLSFGYDFRLEICVLLAFIFSLGTLGNIRDFGYWLGIALKQINCHVTFSVVVGLFLGVVGVVAHVTYRFLCRFCADVDVRKADEHPWEFDKTTEQLNLTEHGRCVDPCLIFALQSLIWFLEELCTPISDFLQHLCGWLFDVPSLKLN